MKGTITSKQKSAIYAIINKMEYLYLKEDLVYGHTEDRTGSVSELSKEEATAFIKTLKSMEKEVLGPMQGKILHYMQMMGYTNQKGFADISKVNDYLIKIGKRNPRKVGLWQMKKRELGAALIQIERHYTTVLQK